MNSKPMPFSPAMKHSAAGILALCVAGALAAGQPAWAQTVNAVTTSTGTTSATSTGTTSTSTGTSAGVTSGTTAGTATATGSTTGTAATTSAAPSGTTSSPATTGTTSSFQSGSFGTFAGSGSNARALFTSLRTGTPTTLSTGTTTGTTGSTSGTTSGAGSYAFTPVTGAMGTGNVRIALALAQDSLARQGITSPTPQQISAALNGGTITAGNPPRVVQMPGVLTLRSQGMGWGKVAQTLGTKLGPVMAASRSGRTSLSSLHRDDHHHRHEAEHRIAHADDHDVARHQPAQGMSHSGARVSAATSTTHRGSEHRIVTAAGTAATGIRGDLHDGQSARGVVTTAAGTGGTSRVRSDDSSGHGTRVALAAPSRGIVTAAGTPATVVTAATSSAMQVRANAISGGGGGAFRSESRIGGAGGGRGGGRGH